MTPLLVAVVAACLHGTMELRIITPRLDAEKTETVCRGNESPVVAMVCVRHKTRRLRGMRCLVDIGGFTGEWL